MRALQGGGVDLAQRVGERRADQPVIDQVGDLAQQAMLRDIDAILSRLETGIPAQRKAIDALLERLSRRKAA